MGTSSARPARDSESACGWRDTAFLDALADSPAGAGLPEDVESSLDALERLLDGILPLCGDPSGDRGTGTPPPARPEPLRCPPGRP